MPIPFDSHIIILGTDTSAEYRVEKDFRTLMRLILST